MQKNKSRFSRSFLTSWAFFAFYTSAFLAQQIDPFYRQLLEKAQKSFLAKNYEEAARDFEIASFGLTGDKTLRAKAYVYLSLSRYYLKDIKSSEKYMREAADLMGEKELATLEIYESALPDLEKLLTFFNIRPAQEESPPQPPQVPEKPIKPDPDTPAKSEEKVPDKNPAKEPTQTQQKTLDELKEGDLLPLDMVDTPPTVIKRVQADYPAAARSFRIEGTIIVNTLISEKGDVIKTEIIKAIKGAFGFNQAAQRAVRQWKFEPATIKGLKVKVWMPIAIEYKKQE